MNRPVAQEPAPFIEKPDEHAPSGQEMYCFMDASRVCSAECVAYLPAQPEGADYEGQPWSACTILVNLHKLGKHHVALAQQGAALLKKQGVKQADEARNNQPLPPKVR